VKDFEEFSSLKDENRDSARPLHWSISQRTSDPYKKETKKGGLAAHLSEMGAKTHKRESTEKEKTPNAKEGVI